MTHPTSPRTADVCDDRGDAVVAPSTQFRSYGAHERFAGPVRTVRCLNDNALIKQAIAEPGDGAVLVVDGGGSLDCELLGGRMARQAADNGWAGLIVHGAVRDQHELAGTPIGVKALGTHPTKSTKTGDGERDTPITIGGAVFRPGARLWADGDGVVVER